MSTLSTTRGHRAKEFSSSGRIKRFRRTNSQMEIALSWVQHFIKEADGDPMTIRHIFYLLAGASIIAKLESAYGLLIKHLSRWRRNGEVAWDAFTDSTRWHIKTPSFGSMEDALANCAATYRRDLWSTQSVYVEVWCEKDAMAQILAKAAEPFGIPVFVARGFASLSSLYSAANTFRAAAAAGKRCVIYHFGDHDPSGLAAGASIVKAFKDDFRVEVEFVRAAVTREQIKKLKLPTRPTKASSHSAKWKGGGSVELDTMPPAEVRKLVESCITQHINKHEWETLKAIEASERETLKAMRPLALPKSDDPEPEPSPEWTAREIKRELDLLNGDNSPEAEKQRKQMRATLEGLS
jgi:hypothetical protein